jgi:hypothetical protein
VTGRSKRLLAPEVLAEGADEVAELAQDSDVSVALIGGYALQLHGSPRLTGDVDVVASGPVRGLRPRKQLSFGGYQSEAPNGVPVDVVLRNDDYDDLYDEALDRSQRMRGAPMRVVTKEYLAAMKMVAGRGRDDADLEWLILSGLNVRRTRGVIRKYLGVYAEQEFEQLVEETKWKASRGLV